MSVPTFVYKIIPSDYPLPSPLPEVLPPSDLDKKDGFIHLSTASQILGTLRLVFANEARVFVLKISYDKVKDSIKWEEGSCVPGAEQATKGEKFPHLYNSLRIGRDEVDSIAEWKKESADWDHVVDNAREEEWLVY